MKAIKGTYFGKEKIRVKAKGESDTPYAYGLAKSTDKQMIIFADKSCNQSVKYLNLSSGECKQVYKTEGGWRPMNVLEVKGGQALLVIEKDYLNWKTSTPFMFIL